MWGSTAQTWHEALSGQSSELSVARVNEADAFGNAEVGAKRQTQKGYAHWRKRPSISLLCCVSDCSLFIVDARKRNQAQNCAKY